MNTDPGTPPGSRREEKDMQLYAIRRRNGWTSPGDLQEAAGVSAAIGDAPGSGVRWIRSYVLGEQSGDLGTVCIYEADSPETIRTHAKAVGMPADEITPVAETVLIRPDPVPAAG